MTDNKERPDSGLVTAPMTTSSRRGRSPAAPSLALATTTAGLLILLNFGAGILAGVSVPGASGVITGFTVPFFLVLLDRTTQRFGMITVAWTIYSTIAIPMHLMGPPNVFKPLFGLLIGLAFDIPITLLKRKDHSYFVGLVSYTLSIVGMAYVAFAWLNLPGSENAFRFIWAIALVFALEGTVSVWMAKRVYVRSIKGSRIEAFFSAGSHEIK